MFSPTKVNKFTDIKLSSPNGRRFEFQNDLHVERTNRGRRFSKAPPADWRDWSTDVTKQSAIGQRPGRS